MKTINRVSHVNFNPHTPPKLCPFEPKIKSNKFPTQINLVDHVRVLRISNGFSVKQDKKALNMKNESFNSFDYDES